MDNVYCTQEESRLMSKGKIQRQNEGDSQAYAARFNKGGGRKKFGFQRRNEDNLKVEDLLLKERETCSQFNAINVKNMVIIEAIVLKNQMIKKEEGSGMLP